MTSATLVASKYTCYKLVTSLSTRAHNVNECTRYVPHMQSTGVCIPSVRCVVTLVYLPYNSLGVLPA